MNRVFQIIVSLFMVLLLTACEDAGDPVTPIDNTPVPVIVSVSPDSGKSGDTITVMGRNFGITQTGSAVRFAGVNGSALVWSDTTITVIIPQSLAGGPLNLTIIRGIKTSNIFSFKIISTVITVSFSGEVAPLFNNKGCAGCHGGSGGLTVLPYSSLMAGNSSNGPVITAGNGEGSVLVKKLRGTAGFGDRMPQGGSPLSENDIQKIVQWINQGAQNN